MRRPGQCGALLLVPSGLVVGVVLVFIPGLGVFIAPELLGGGKMMMVGNLIQAQFGYSRNWPFGAALAFVLLALVLAATHALRLRLRGGEMSGGARLLRFPGTGAVAVLTLLYLYLPIVLVVALSFNTAPMIAIWSGFSMQWYADALASEPGRRALGNSVVIALVAMLGGTLSAILAALALSGRGRAALGHRAAWMERLIGLLLLGIPLGLWGIMAAHTMIAIPFADLPISARLHDMDPALVEAAADLFGTPWQALPARGAAADLARRARRCDTGLYGFAGRLHLQLLPLGTWHHHAAGLSLWYDPHRADAGG